jgi:AcrR family transcriptional regulator
MPRKMIEGADEKIIQATLDVAGNGPRGTFSTREIARLSGVSEFTVFSRFKNKEAMIDACNDFVFKKLLEIDEKAQQNNPHNPQGFFNEVLGDLLANPSWTHFAGNYSLVFPRQGDLEKYDSFNKIFRTMWLNRGTNVPVTNEEEAYSSLLFSIRELLQDALFILSGEIQDTPKNRQTMFELYEGGMANFVTIA